MGAFMLDKMAKHEETKTKVLGQLEQYLTRADDRKLFGLSPLPETASQVEPTAA